MKNILYLSNCYSHPNDVNVGAAPRHFYNVRALRKSGYHVEIITSSQNTITGQSLNTYTQNLKGVHYAEASPMKNKSLFSRLKYYLSHFISGISARKSLDKKPDIILASMPTVFIGLQALILAKIYRCKIILDVRDLWTDSLRATKIGKYKPVIAINYFIERLIYRKADSIFCTTKPQCEEVRKMVSMENKEIEYLPNGFDIELLKSDCIQIKEMEEIKNKYEKVVLFAGKHSDYTDLNNVLNSSQGFGELNIGVVLLGGGYLKESLKERANKENLKNIHFLGPVSKDEVLSYMEYADIFLINYSKSDAWRKVLPNKLFDYLYFNKPIVAAVCEGEITKIIKESGAGISCEPQDTNSLITSVQKVVKESKKFTTGRDYLMKNFDRRILTKKLLEIVEKV